MPKARTTKQSWLLPKNMPCLSGFSLWRIAGRCSPSKIFIWLEGMLWDRQRTLPAEKGFSFLPVWPRAKNILAVFMELLSVDHKALGSSLSCENVHKRSIYSADGGQGCLRKAAYSVSGQQLAVLASDPFFLKYRLLWFVFSIMNFHVLLWRLAQLQKVSITGSEGIPRTIPFF